MKRVWLFLLFTCMVTLVSAQETADSVRVFDYSTPQDYEIGGVTVKGADYSDDNAIVSIAGFKVGDKIRIPGGGIPKAIKALWKLRLFTDVQIYKTKTLGDVVFLEVVVVERPRLTGHSYANLKKSYHDDLNKEVNKYLLKGGIVTENVKVNAANSIKRFLMDKGFLDAVVDVQEIPDDKRQNAIRLVFDVDRGERVKIYDIVFSGNENIKDRKLRNLMKETRRKRRIFANSKLIKDSYKEDKDKLVTFYNTLGFRDAKVVSDEITRNEKGHLILNINIDEGNRYFFRNISWKGNSIYDTPTLAQVLGIEKGDVYNEELLETRLRFSQDGRDVSTLYLDNGYLFFQVDPVETSVVNDSIDLEIRIFEGSQATIDKVTIKGNDRTHEHVIRRELRTLPGQKFSRSDIIRSQREIINLNYFNPETLGINTPVNPQRGTVDIEYAVEEKPSDQLELSAGWGGNRGVIGTLGVSFNNFSLRNITDRSTWNPLPQGDGQRLSLRAQTNGQFYQSYNVSFTEPWLGGRKPNSLTVAGFYNRFNTFGQRLNIWQGSVSIGTRLKWPDDNFVSSTAVNIQVLSLDNWARGLFQTDEGDSVTDGNYNNFSIRQTFARSSVNDPIFPKTGSSFTLTLQFTPPYSAFKKDFEPDDNPEERFKFLEYHKWRFNAEWYTPLFDKFVLKADAKMGVLGSYNRDIGISPFERFQLGGDGLNNQQFGFAGVDIISMRGYEINDFENSQNDILQRTTATPIFDKFTLELRYPFSTNPNSTIYAHVFAQAGNTWRNIRDFNPFELKRSYGAGIRVFLPMFGVLGFDYGIGIDKASNDRSAGGLSTFNIVLGFEPE